MSATRPLVFERNSGQAPAGYAAIARSSRVDAAFHTTGVALAVKDSATNSSAALALVFRGGSPVVPIEEGALAGRVHYLRGADARRWTTDVPTFERVRYRNVYPGIDAVFYGTDEQLEYDFVVAPRADPRAIALTFSGADSIRTNGGGDVIVSAAGHAMTQKRPVAYQERDGRRRPVPVSYAITDDGAVTFALGAYDHDAPLTIDPMIVLSRFFGGSTGDFAKRVVTRGGSVYVAGETCSADFPTTPGAFQPSPNGTLCDAFITKLSGDGTQTIFSTYLGGTSTDYANGLDVDASGAVYVAGYTASTNFPTTPGAFDRVCGGTCSNGSSAGDGWAAKIASSGSSLVYSTYVGGSGTDFFYGLAVNAAGEAVVTGESASTDFPTTPGAPQRTLNGGRDSVITKVSADGSSLVYSTYFGGSGLGEFGFSVVYDASGNAWAVGQTDSANLPVLGAFQPSLAGGTDGFVVELTPAGSLAFASYFGGDGDDVLFGVAADPTGIYVTGPSQSTLLPGQASARDVAAKKMAAAIAQLAVNGSHVIKTQLLDGSANDTGSHVIVTHPSGSPALVHVVGSTTSNDFPFTSGAWQKTPAPDPSGPFDLFYATLPLDGGGALAAPSFATFLGGSGGTESFPNLASDGSDGVFLVTSSDNSFPRINAAPGTKATQVVLVHIVPESRWTESVAGEIHLYAADAATTGDDWSLAADPTAADGRRAANVDRGAPKVTAPLATPSSYVEWTFDADPGAYRIWVRGIAAGNSFNNDSVYVQFSDSVDSAGNQTWRIGTTSATPVILEDCIGCGVHGWGWNDNGYGAGVLGPLVRFNAAGHHVMRVQAREDGLSIDQVVLTKSQYLNAAPGATKDDVTVLKRSGTVTPPPPPPPPGDCTAGEVVVYPGIHSTVVGGAATWHTVADAAAAGGARVFYPDAGAAKVTAPSASPSSFFTISFAADANVDYRIWMRGKAQNNFWGNDSAWVQFNDAIDASGNPLWRTGTASGTSVNLEDCSGCGESEWGWQDNGYGAGVLGPAVRFPTSGTHSMLVQIREDGFSIDQIVVSSGKYLGAAPGALKNDTTKLPECQAPPLR